MFELLTWMTGGVIVFSVVAAYRRSRDPLHPLMFLGPMLLYMYVFRPLMLYYPGNLARLFENMDDLDFVQMFNLLGIMAFCMGCLRYRLPRGASAVVGRAFMPSPRLRRWLFSVSLIFGLFGVFAFLYVTYTSGGFIKVYSVAKGGGRAVSGYLGDGQHLTLPAIVLLILSTQGRRWTLERVALLVLFAAPYLVIGFIGTRRGPAFGVLFCLLVPWYLASGRRPSLRSFVAALGFIGLTVLLLFSQRKLIRLGGDLDLDPGRLSSVLAPSGEGLLTGETYVFASGLMLTSKAYDHHYWGQRYAVTFLVRPIPRQLWPTKYRDTGMGWMLEQDMPGGMPIRYWRQAVGWGPESGAASGFIADLYLEFSWLALLGCYWVGTLFGFLWRKALLFKGVWTLLYAEACILSIYVPTQSLSAFLHRFLLIAVPISLIWRVRTVAVQRQERRRIGPPPGAAEKGGA